MACARKVYSYGVKKKDGGNLASPWGSLKEDNKESKLPAKKSVWSKATGKTLSSKINKVPKADYDPFELPDDIFEDSKDNDVRKGAEKSDKKTFDISPKKSLKSKICGKSLPQKVSNSPKLKVFKEFDNEESIIFPTPQNTSRNSRTLLDSPIEKANQKASKSASVKACKTVLDAAEDTAKTLSPITKSPIVVKSKILGKPLPQNRVTINAEELKLKTKNKSLAEVRNGLLKLKSPKNSPIKKLKTPTKQTQKISKKNSKDLSVTNSDKKTIKKNSVSNGAKATVKKTITKSAKSNATKNTKDSKASSSAKKVGTKNVKAANTPASVKNKNKDSKFVTPKRGSVKNGPSKSSAKRIQLIKSASAVKKKRIGNKTKSSKVSTAKNTPKGVKRKVSASSKVQVKKTMLDVNKVSPRVRVTKAKINSKNLSSGDELSSPKSKKLKATKGKLTERLQQEALSVQFIDDNTVLAIKQKDIKHVLKDDVVFDQLKDAETISNEASDTSESHVTSDNELERQINELLGTNDDSKVAKKKSLFSYYDRNESQTSPNYNGTNEFDFPSEGGEDEIDNIEESLDTKLTNPLKRGLSSDQGECYTPAKKNKQDDGPKVSFAEFDDRNDLDVEDIFGQPKTQAKASPFKSLKTSPSVFKQRKDSRRFSSLPTNVSLNATVEEEDEEKDTSEMGTPPPLYRTKIFGFGKSGVKVRVPRGEKELYTIVKNTKHAHECLEYGESQQFKDDLEYLLDGLRSKHNVSTRCLSALELASKCVAPEFRMHIKAHGLVENIFSVLEDAFSDERLLLCASMIMYVLAKDKLKINFNKETIGFMLKVITKQSEEEDLPKAQAYEKMIKKIRGIFGKLEDVDIDLEMIDAKTLAREALLSLTVKRTGDWFKDEIRLLGGLDDIADQVYYCCNCVQKRMKVDANCVQMKRYLALFIDMTHKSTVNQVYLVTCRNSVVIESCVRTLHSITKMDMEKEVSNAVAECLMSIQLLLMNLSHENTSACLKICKERNGLSSILRSALHLSLYLPAHLAYENTIVSLCLLVNLVENNAHNRSTLNKTRTRSYIGHRDDGKKESVSKLVPPVEALMQMFLLHSERCKEADLMQELEKLEQEESEQNAGRHYQDDEFGLVCGDKFEDTIDDEEKSETPAETTEKPLKVAVDDKSLDGPLNEKEKSDIQSTLDKAQRHMEDSHLAAYTALLIGVLTEEDMDNQKIIHSLLPDGNFNLLADSIEKIHSFMQMTSPLSKSDQETMQRIMELIRNCNETFKEKG